MSYQSLYKVRKSGDVEHIKDYSNSFLGAFLVWDEMSKKHLCMKVPIQGNMRPVWNLHKSESVPYCERILMMATFDNIMVKKENFTLLVDSIMECDSRLTGHFRQNAVMIQSLLDDDDCIAICWNQTSVCASPWTVYDGEEGRPYNIYKDTKHWFMFGGEENAQP